MQGINIVIKGADFSANNLGNINPVFGFIEESGITDDDIKSALYSLYDSLVAEGLWAKIEVLYPFVGGTASAHRLNLKSYANYPLTFINDVVGAHTVAGYVLEKASSRYATIPGFVNTRQDDLHMAIFNSTADDTTASSVLIGNNGATPTQYKYLARNFSSRTAFTFGSAVNMVVAGTGYDRTKTGLIVGSKLTSLQRKLYDDGVVIATGASTANTPSATYGLWAIGGYPSAIPANFSNATLGFASVGYGLTDDEVLAFNTIVSDFQLSVR